MVCEDQVEAELPAAAERPDAGHGAERPLRQSGLLKTERLKQAVIGRALSEGFSVARVASVDAIPDAPARLAAWLAQDHHGEMGWMEERTAQRADPRQLWAEAKSVVMLGMSYAPDSDPLAMLGQPDKAAISLYARRRDYHDVIKGKLKSVAGLLAAQGGVDVKVFVDTAPVMEKPLAQAAGLGWQGKHTVLVSREHGSWLFLGAIYTTADLPVDEPETDHCGSCTRCLDICPTDAFPAPYQLDSRRCIAYLTIEHPGHIDAELRPGIGNRVFGCDDCLAVCPWNKFAEAAHETRLSLRDEIEGLQLTELARLDDPAFRTLFAGTPVKRTGRDRFVRNVLIAIGNSGRHELASSAVSLLRDSSPLVRAMAAWALIRLDPSQGRALAGEALAMEKDEDVRREWLALRPAPELPA
ncbi:tRNA epoxyqueuosine(34) reductase QueG [Bosea sp. (in: a-proteobacteria)]|uniref:tRNA epoxyqueuosine(34) reductase QueG n=1 Tax=Bosea sp. (in: a-proteobacteria) TaxID=1871050 RepID=UPI00273423E8|nr:tRNA epoxyqueuosine(34) reductase QueG [Bosea sp. (in: a-proteobacteria)]MDP3407463.1 tRNA epoxyqueuosine(34) reductase QueG [Bosea sp. (in: a-proteobacteria)]